MIRLTDRELRDSKTAKSKIESFYMTRSPGDTYFVNEDLKQDWSKAEVKKFEKLWKKGMNIYDISDELDCGPDEAFLLLFDRIRRMNGRGLEIDFKQLLLGDGE